jgi:hypothetical protein
LTLFTSSRFPPTRNREVLWHALSLHALAAVPPRRSKIPHTKRLVKKRTLVRSPAH